MPRARLLKPEFFKDEELGKLSRDHRYLFEGLWCLVDREGRMEDRPAYIKNEVFPYDLDVTPDLVDRWLTDLAAPRIGDAHCEPREEGFISRYVVGGKRYLFVHAFAKHQRPHTNEPASSLPEVPAVAVRGPDGRYYVPGDLDRAVARRKAAASTIVASPPTNGASALTHPETESVAVAVAERVDSAADAALALTPVEAAAFGLPQQPARSDEHEVFDYWRERLGHPDAKFTDGRRGKIRGRLREGFTVAQLRRAIDGCAASPFHRGENDRHTAYDDLTLICRDGAKVEQFMALPLDRFGSAALARARDSPLPKAQARRESLNAFAQGVLSGATEAQAGEPEEARGGSGGPRGEPAGA